MTANLPFRSLLVGPHRWKIVISSQALEATEAELDSNLWGMTDWNTWTITIRSGLPAEKLRETLIHELVHAFYGTYPNDGTEESIALIMGLGMSLLLVQNKRFAAWLIE